MTELTIVIVSYNTRADLEACLRSLTESSPGVPHEIVVVDNGSADGSAEAARCFKGVQVIDAGANLGFARANNVGIRGSDSELVLLLNSDTLVPPGAIDALVQDLRAHPDVGIVGPRIVDGNGRPEISFGRMIGPINELRQKVVGRLYAHGNRVLTRWVERRVHEEHYPDWVSGACLLVRRAVAEVVGLLDERYFIYMEDVDFCAAVRAAGMKVRFTPKAQIVHYRGRAVATNRQVVNLAYRRAHIAFYEKHHKRWAPLLKLYLALTGSRRG
ncbi:MAG: glycosyltransferase family 2 protein [Bacteroidales bacterium]